VAGVVVAGVVVADAVVAGVVVSGGGVARPVVPGGDWQLVLKAKATNRIPNIRTSRFIGLSPRKENEL
jgi:hypothetical protein